MSNFGKINTIDLICIDKNNGNKIDIPKTNLVSDLKDKCESYRGNKTKNLIEGKVLFKDDWINPDKGWICRSNPLDGSKPKLYFSKRDCNKAQLYDKSVIYKRKTDKSPFKPIKINHRIKPFIRKWSRNIILVITILTIFIFYLIWLFIFSRNNRVQAKEFTSFFKKYIFFVLLAIFLFGIYLSYFCPFNICYLDPDSSEFRSNPQLFIHTVFCNTMKLLNIPFIGCNQKQNICDITNNKYFGCSN